MTIIVLSEAEATAEYIPYDHLPSVEKDLMVDLPNDVDPSVLKKDFARIKLICLNFPSFSDGRAFSQAQRLRQLGFQGTLRALGHLIPDQRPLAERCGIDEFALSRELIARTTQDAWDQITPSKNYHQRLL